MDSQNNISAEQQAFHQHLTQTVTQALQDCSTLAVMRLDLDQAEVIKQNLGAEVSEQVLQEVAKRLRQGMSNGRDLARIGESGFAILFTDFLQPDSIEIFLQTIINQLKKPLVINDQKLVISASVGVSTLAAGQSCQPELLLQQAELALLHSKDLGGSNYQFYTAALNTTVTQQLKLETELHEAIAHHQFVIYYQPIVDSTTKKIVSAEALLRWQHPQHGLLLPDMFLSLCESTGLIVTLGKYVLEKACQQLKVWHAAGFSDLRIAINLSAEQVAHKDLVAQISEVIKNTNINVASLKLEIAESSILQDMPARIVLLHELQKLGVRLVLDNFSGNDVMLKNLNRFPFKVLKLDKKLVQENAIGIISNIIALAKILGLSVTAMGVETQEQLRFLIEKHCDSIQGYLFSKPLPAEEFIQLLKTNQ